ncbi:DUF4922 domain-containing protein [uncultured Acetobacteroides sp.]|uniref:DUF4922 domain-containing protein n=1 Tax=uncultured Acetobacteroides sp. TaxID=1760811 RepID=UPI0029F594DE|nr:DUF4922 domain-containing protein [uncultured Acetobacteroides sp.]
MNSAVNTLLKEQCVEWQQCGENYAALETVEVRNTQIEGYSFKVQFNPKRIQSSAAKVDPKSIKERKCFLCEANRPAVQRGIPFAAKSGNAYTILVNPFPIFKKHLTIPAVDHIDQRIDGKIADMLELAGCLTDYLIFYNGPKCGASAPDHFHFQAGNKGFLPIEMDIEAILSSQAKQVAPDVYVLNNAAAHTIVCKSASINTIICWFNQFYSKFRQITNSEEEPMLNLLAWVNNGHYHLVVYPRKTHRPSQFFAEGDANILISPASIDLGGIFITPLEKDFSKLTETDIKDILQQITVTPDVFNKLIQ